MFFHIWMKFKGVVYKLHKFDHILTQKIKLLGQCRLKYKSHITSWLKYFSSLIPAKIKRKSLNFPSSLTHFSPQKPFVYFMSKQQGKLASTAASDCVAFCCSSFVFYSSELKGEKCESEKMNQFKIHPSTEIH